MPCIALLPLFSLSYLISLQPGCSIFLLFRQEAPCPVHFWLWDNSNWDVWIRGEYKWGVQTRAWCALFVVPSWTTDFYFERLLLLANSKMILTVGLTFFALNLLASNRDWRSRRPKCLSFQGKRTDRIQANPVGVLGRPCSITSKS